MTIEQIAPHIRISHEVLEDALCLPRGIRIVQCGKADTDTAYLLLERDGPESLPAGELVALLTKRVDRAGRYIITTELQDREGRTLARSEGN
jgi:hypothetical protein